MGGPFTLPAGFEDAQAVVALPTGFEDAKPITVASKTVTNPTTGITTPSSMMGDKAGVAGTFKEQWNLIGQTIKNNFSLEGIRGMGKAVSESLKRYKDDPNVDRWDEFVGALKQSLNPGSLVGNAISGVGLEALTPEGVKESEPVKGKEVALPVGHEDAAPVPKEVVPTPEVQLPAGHEDAAPVDWAAEKAKLPLEEQAKLPLAEGETPSSPDETQMRLGNAFETMGNNNEEWAKRHPLNNDAPFLPHETWDRDSAFIQGGLDPEEEGGTQATFFSGDDDHRSVAIFSGANRYAVEETYRNPENGAETTVRKHEFGTAAQVKKFVKNNYGLDNISKMLDTSAEKSIKLKDKNFLKGMNIGDSEKPGPGAANIHDPSFNDYGAGKAADFLNGIPLKDISASTSKMAKYTDFDLSLERDLTGSDFARYFATGGDAQPPELRQQIKAILNEYHTNPKFKEVADAGRHYVHNNEQIVNASRGALGMKTFADPIPGRSLSDFGRAKFPVDDGNNYWPVDKSTTLLDGKEYGKPLMTESEAKAHANNLLNGIRHSQEVNTPLWRGMGVNPRKIGDFVHLKPGDSISLPLSSFSESDGVAAGFAGVGTAAYQSDIPVMFKLEGPHKSISMKALNSFDEQEHVTAGNFEVIKIDLGKTLTSDGPKHILIHLKQMETF